MGGYEGNVTCGIELTRRCEVCRSLRSVRLWTLESLTLEVERRADAPLAASSAGYRKVRICMLLKITMFVGGQSGASRYIKPCGEHVKGHGVEMWSRSRLRFQAFRSEGERYVIQERPSN
jgi:hypothetical protein